jgi:hypothetical protein
MIQFLICLILFPSDFSLQYFYRVTVRSKKQVAAYGKVAVPPLEENPVLHSVFIA